MVQIIVEYIDMDPRVHNALDFGFNSDNPDFLYIILKESPEESILIHTSQIKHLRINGIKDEK